MHYRPLFRKFFWFGLIPTMIALFICGGAPAEEPYVVISQLATAYYFLHFLVILPIISQIEVPKPLPFSITEAVLGTAAAPEAARTGSVDGGDAGTATDGSLQPAE